MQVVRKEGEGISSNVDTCGQLEG